MSFFTSSSSSTPKSSSSANAWLYDVFLTFHAKHPSISSLESSLRDSAIKTFIDPNKGVTSNLSEAIGRSRIAVVVFAKEFVYCRDCLKKLDRIMECQKNTGKMVFAVFCGVSPSEVRQENDRLAGVSQKDREVARWRRQLTEATRLFGWTLSSSSSTSDNKIIKEITCLIKVELDMPFLDMPRHLMGIQHRVKEVLHLAKYYSNIVIRKEYVITVGIWGTGGIGKTTLARAIYDSFSGSFESQCYLENITNVMEKQNGLGCLREQLISDIHTKHEKILDSKMEIRRITPTLRNKRALVVLDDVSEVHQFKALCGTDAWFGFGSMILITTKNKHILDELQVKYIYEMKKLDNSESLDLFSWNAFKQYSPRNDFNILARKVITYCEGLPLVLEVLGSLLFNRTIPEWKSVLNKIKCISPGQIQEKLRICYEYLDDAIKDIFFNIACFYVGEEKQYVMQKLGGFRFPIETGINMLIEQSLVKVDMNGKLNMHDLLQEFGKGLNRNKPTAKYNVFLSFRGEDTRKSFASHLYVALKNAGVEVFMDNGIKRGESISSTLMQAIESSKMSIVIFSINYAGSKWCLQELEKIMECHRTFHQEVLPIFYGVQPSDVRKQTGNFGKALEGLIRRTTATKDKKLSWTKALNDAANLSGWDSLQYRTEVELINNVIETVTMKLDNNTLLFVADHPVGVKSRVQEIIQLLSAKSDEIVIVGIFGMGGIGKTTIAKAIYNEISQSFDGKSFLTNIREIWEQVNGHVYLQEQLLLDILQTRRMTLYSVEFGKAIMKERLCHKRALVVLDDINNVDQLNALCGSREWFGPGSRIIITTRDEHLLKILQVDNEYNMKDMDDDESLELFSWHAFKQASPLEDFVELSRRVIAYSEGLPLALEILGACLRDRTMQDWECVLDKLCGIPNDQIHKKLRISYDGLSDDSEKDIFLDICCFLIGKDRNYATQILDGCGLHAEFGITRLIELSLVKVDKNNKLDMHGLLRDMGREIIREKSVEEPEKRTRLWCHNDVVDVLRNHLGTISVKGLALNLSRTNMLSFDTVSFKMMRRLRLLQLGYVKLDGNYEYLSKELRWLHWHGFPLSHMPKDFYQENVVAIDLKYSYLTQVWNNCQLLERLKILNLSHSYYLRQTPNFSNLPNLEKLLLKDCPRLCFVHPSIGDLKYLIVVNMKNCKDLIDVPRSFYNLKSVKTLIITGCSRIDKLEEGIDQMESLTTLLANDTAITKVPFSLARARSIKYLSLCGYQGLPHDVFPSLIWSWMSPRNNPRSLIRAFASMPFLLQNLFHNLSNQSSGKWETKASASHILCAETSALIGFHDQVNDIGAEKFTSSLAIQFGGFNKAIDTLLKSITQEWSDTGFGCSLPKDNYPNWLGFENEGSTILFKVSHIVGHFLKGMILCIIYSSRQDSMAFVYPVSVIIKNFTKATIEFYRRGAETTSNDEEWENIISNLEPGNEVEVKVDFAHKYLIKKTAVYLVYGEETDKRSGGIII